MSRYPSAYGHTPSYRSVGSMPVYPSALGARDSDLSFRVSYRVLLKSFPQNVLRL